MQVSNKIQQETVLRVKYHTNLILEFDEILFLRFWWNVIMCFIFVSAVIWLSLIIKKKKKQPNKGCLIHLRFTIFGLPDKYQPKEEGRSHDHMVLILISMVSHPCIHAGSNHHMDYILESNVLLAIGQTASPLVPYLLNWMPVWWGQKKINFCPIFLIGCIFGEEKNELLPFLLNWLHVWWGQKTINFCPTYLIVCMFGEEKINFCPIFLTGCMFGEEKMNFCPSFLTGCMFGEDRKQSIFVCFVCPTYLIGCMFGEDSIQLITYLFWATVKTVAPRHCGWPDALSPHAARPRAIV